MMNLAKKLAKKSLCNNQHGAVIAKGRRVYGTGINTLKTSPTWGGGPMSSIHAEAAAIREAVNRGIDLRGKDIFVARVGKSNYMSRPCKTCKKMILAAGIRKVYYTDASGNIVSEWPT